MRKENTARQMEVRVRQTASGPLIHVNGKPVPPRFFAGLQGGSVRAAPEWRSFEFDFTMPDKTTPEADTVATAGSLTFRFNNPGAVWLKEVSVVNLANGKNAVTPGSFDDAESYESTWLTTRAEKPTRTEPDVTTVWSPEGVKVSLSGKVSGWWPTFRLHNREGAILLEPGQTYRCTFKARSPESALVNVTMSGKVGGAWQQVGEPPSDLFASQLRMARAAGIRLCHAQMPTCFYAPEQAQDWSAIDNKFREIIAIVPDALIVPRVLADVPHWWLQRHPESATIYEDGSRCHKASVHCPVYRRAMSDHFEKLCRHLSETFPQNFAGILPLGQGTLEWYYEKSLGTLLSGYDLPTTTAWRTWLKQRGDPAWEGAVVPSAVDRRAGSQGMLRDPSKDKILIEFARFRQEQMADTILELAAACRRGTDGKKLVLFFYGYLFEMGMVQTAAHETGHYALSRVLASKDIDILCAPLSYTDRAWASSSPSMTVTESIQDAGILWLNEDDCRTHLSGTLGLGGVTTPEQSIDILRRSRGQALVRGFADWWFDIRDMGWHDDPDMWQIQQQLNPAEELRLKSDTPFTPQILTVADEDSFNFLAGNARPLTLPLVYASRAAFGRCGTPYGQVLLDDVASGRFNAPLQFFLAAWSLTEPQRAGLRKNRAPGITRVWCHAPGYLRPSGFSIDGIKEVTGFRVEPHHADSAVATPTAAGRTLLGISAAWGPATNINPLFKVIPESADQILATFGDGSPALVLRETGVGKDLFLATPAVSPELIRGVAKLSGVHLYTETDAALWAHKDLVSVHTLSEGTLKVTWPHAGAIKELFSGKLHGTGSTLEIPVRKGETLLLQNAKEGAK